MVYQKEKKKIFLVTPVGEIRWEKKRQVSCGLCKCRRVRGKRKHVSSYRFSKEKAVVPPLDRSTEVRILVDVVVEECPE